MVQRVVLPRLYRNAKPMGNPKHVRQKKAKAKAAAKAVAGQMEDADPDNNMEKDTNSYTEKHGKWRRNAMRSFHNRDNWRRIIVMHTTFAPVLHLDRLIMSQKDPWKMLHFVTHKCSEMLVEFAECISPTAYVDKWGALASITEEFEMPEWIESAVGHSLSLAVEYHLRFFIPFSSFPRRIGWLIARPPDEYCEVRRGIANEMLMHTADLSP